MKNDTFLYRCEKASTKMHKVNKRNKRNQQLRSNRTHQIVKTIKIIRVITRVTVTEEEETVRRTTVAISIIKNKQTPQLLDDNWLTILKVSSSS